MSFRKAYWIAGAAEAAYSCLPGKEPPLTRYSVGLLSRSLTFDGARARAVLGHRPVVGTFEGLERFASWWRKHDR